MIVVHPSAPAYIPKGAPRLYYWLMNKIRKFDVRVSRWPRWMIGILGLWLLCSFPGQSQPSPTNPYQIRIVQSDPAGACPSPYFFQFNSTSGAFWGCKAGTWTQITGSGGGGDPITSPNATLSVGGTSAATTLDVVPLTGDVTTTGANVSTVVKVNGVVYPATPSTNTVPVVTSSNTITYEAVPNAALANASTTVNGQTCTLGASCTATAAPSGSASGSLAGSYPSPTIATSVSLPGSPTTTTQAALTSNTTVATTAYTDSAVSTAIAGVNPAVAVQAATTAAGDTSALTYNNGASGVGATLTGTNNTAITIDGFTFTTLGQRLLVKNDTQSPSGAFNGIYFVTQVQGVALPPIFTRSLDYDQPSDMNNTGAIPVVNGTLNASTTWVLTSAVATVGTSPLTYTKFSLNPSTIVTTSRNVNTTAPLGGGGALSSDLTLTLSANNQIRSLGAGFDGGGSALTSGSTSTVYFTAPSACTIAAWNITVDTGTITFDIWKIATGTAIPTVTNTITASALPALSTGTALHSTTLTGWTTSVSANDIFGININTVASATKASLVIQCNATT